jgi:LysM repeat protein
MVENSGLAGHMAGTAKGAERTKMVIQDRTTRSLQEVRDPDHEDEGWEREHYAGPTNVLWGRVLALGFALLFVFLIGRISAPGGVAQSEVTALRSRLTTSQQQVSSLKGQVTAAQAEAAKAQASPAPSASTSPATTVTGQGTSYTVQSGDTLHSIAAKFYGDSSLAAFIAESNNLPQSSHLQVDQKLTIPPKP